MARRTLEKSKTWYPTFIINQIEHTYFEHKTTCCVLGMHDTCLAVVKCFHVFIVL
jgi:hypothetical protein